MVKISGVKKHSDRMRTLAGGAGGGGGRMAEKISQVLFAAGKNLADDMALSITEGSVSGKNHVASRPGEAPNNADGDLVPSIEAIQVEPLKTVVSVNAPHAVPLEFGTSKMAERPFARPAAERMRKTLPAEIAAAVSKIVRETK